MHRFSVGDCVRIRSAKAIKADGHVVSDHCALACYTGSTAEVIGLVGSDRYRLQPIDIEVAFDPNGENIFSMSFYGWHDWALEPYKEESDASTGFDIVFD